MWKSADFDDPEFHRLSKDSFPLLNIKLMELELISEEALTFFKLNYYIIQLVYNYAKDQL